MSVPVILRSPASAEPQTIVPVDAGASPPGDTWPCWPLPLPRSPGRNGAAPAALAR